MTRQQAPQFLISSCTLDHFLKTVASPSTFFSKKLIKVAFSQHTHAHTHVPFKPCNYDVFLIKNTAHKRVSRILLTCGTTSFVLQIVISFWKKNFSHDIHFRLISNLLLKGISFQHTVSVHVIFRSEAWTWILPSKYNFQVMFVCKLLLKVHSLKGAVITHHLSHSCLSLQMRCLEIIRSPWTRFIKFDPPAVPLQPVNQACNIVNQTSSTLKAKLFLSLVYNIILRKQVHSMLLRVRACVRGCVCVCERARERTSSPHFYFSFSYSLLRFSCFVWVLIGGTHGAPRRFIFPREMYGTSLFIDSVRLKRYGRTIALMGFEHYTLIQLV